MSNIRFFAFVVSFIFTNFLAGAQNYPVYSNFYGNLHLYNPAEVGNEGYLMVFANHRRQWMGIEGAPMVSTFNLHTPFNKSRGAFGLKISTYARGLLSTNDAMITYGYHFPVSSSVNIRFGLSGGLVSNGLDLSNTQDLDDPAILNYLDNNLQPAGNFGLKIESNSLSFGLSMPQLFGQSFIYRENFEALNNLSPFDNLVGMVYYRKKLAPTVPLRKKGGSKDIIEQDLGYAPLEFYLVYRYSSYGNSQFEALGKLNLSDNFWVGAGYIQELGLTANVGVKYSGFSLGYAYEPSPTLVSGLINGTHEVQLGLRLGQKKTPKKTIEIRSGLRQTKLLNDDHTARYQGNEETEIKETTKLGKKENKKRYLVYIKDFKDFPSADGFREKLREESLDADVYYYEATKRYYVYIFESKKKNDAKTEAKNLGVLTQYKNVRVLTVEEED